MHLAIDIQPEQYNAWKNLGVSLEHQEQYEEAAECYLKAVVCSEGEKRTIDHLFRLVERHPSLKETPALRDVDFIDE